MSGHRNLLFQTGIYRCEWKSVYHNLALLIRTVYKKTPTMGVFFAKKFIINLVSLSDFLFFSVQNIRIFFTGLSDFFRVRFGMYWGFDPVLFGCLSDVLREFFRKSGCFLRGVPEEVP